MIVHLADLPTGESLDVCDSSFFTAQTHACLPSPAQVRQRAQQDSEYPLERSRPRPAVFEELGLLVKFGLDITIAEAQCLWFFNHHMQDQVPTPELYGWRHDDGQTFLYMQLVHGDTLEMRWQTRDEETRASICRQLKSCVEAWRTLQQEEEPYFVG